jgi:hypothetical protein
MANLAVAGFTRTEFGGEWTDAKTGETACEVTFDTYDGKTFAVDVWRPETGTITYRDVIVLPAHGIPEFGVENDLAVSMDEPGYDLPVSVSFGIARSAGTRDGEDHGEMFLRTFVEALEGGYEDAVRRHDERLASGRPD